jgi:hypothetical protein
MDWTAGEACCGVMLVVPRACLERRRLIAKAPVVCAAMRRRLLISALLLMTGLCLAAGVRSYWLYDGAIIYYTDDRVLFCAANAGSLVLDTVRVPPQRLPLFQWLHGGGGSTRLPHSHFGFVAYRDRLEQTVAVPFWFIAAFPVFAAWRVYRHRPNSSGMCVHCGYDLRATPESGGELLAVCPECGQSRVSV